MRSLAAALTLALTFAATAAHAQEAAPMPPIPPPLVVPPPPVAVLQPAPPPWATAQAGRALAHRGHVKKVAGALLIGLGSAAVVGGVILNVLDQKCVDQRCGSLWHDDGPLAAPSVALGVVGGAAILAGIPTYIVGGFEVARGRRIEMTGFGAAPTLGANSVSGAMASASFRF